MSAKRNSTTATQRTTRRRLFVDDAVDATLVDSTTPITAIPAEVYHEPEVVRSYKAVLVMNNMPTSKDPQASPSYAALTSPRKPTESSVPLTTPTKTRQRRSRRGRGGRRQRSPSNTPRTFVVEQPDYTPDSTGNSSSTDSEDYIEAEVETEPESCDSYSSSEQEEPSSSSSIAYSVPAVVLEREYSLFSGPTSPFFSFTSSIGGGSSPVRRTSQVSVSVSVVHDNSNNSNSNNNALTSFSSLFTNPFFVMATSVY